MSKTTHNLHTSLTNLTRQINSDENSASATFTPVICCVVCLKMKPEYDPEIFVEQFPLVKLFLYHIIYFHEINKIYNSIHLESVLWTYTINAHLLQATMTWCMVFGAEGCNQTHWKRLSKRDCEKLQSSFRKRLEEVTGISLDQWNDYWSEITTFRNKYVAHRELKYDNPVPNFSNAINIALFYDKWIREIIAPDILEEPPLEKFVNKLKSSTVPLIEKLLTITKEYNLSTEQQL